MIEFSVQTCANKNGFKAISYETIYFTGGSAGTRTLDPLIKSQLLYQLSYKTLFKGCKDKLFYGIFINAIANAFALTVRVKKIAYVIYIIISAML
jgi:hypothetical protein